MLTILGQEEKLVQEDHFPRRDTAAAIEHYAKAMIVLGGPNDGVTVRS